MAKKHRKVVGSVLKSKEGSGSYVKIKDNITLNAGDILNVESKADRLASLDSAVSAGKLTEDYADQQREYINKIPDFVLFELSTLVEVEA